MKILAKKPIALLAVLLTVSALLTPAFAAPHSSKHLDLAVSLVGEDGAIPNVAEPGELLTYSITITNKIGKPRLITVSETVPDGTSNAGSDDFSGVCNAGAAAGTTCALDNVVIPGNESTILAFTIVVDNPATTGLIRNTVTATGVDCTTSDCDETTPVNSESAMGFQAISESEWGEASIRKILHAFAYGGLGTDSQINTWASMTPETAIVEMLSFSYSNEKLSPHEDASYLYNTSLANLQDFWGSDVPANPMRWDKRRLYATLLEPANDGRTVFNPENLQRTWIQAVNTRGINPFLHKVAFYLTNYQMAIGISNGRGILRDYYDKTLANIVSGIPFTEIIADSAKAAVVARRYGHNTQRYDSERMTLFGNDDFAREFFQLFFRLQGESEDEDYHENVTIENNAIVLTGMNIDAEINAYGSTSYFDWFIAPILFFDHTDPYGNEIKNSTNHYADCVEILHTNICGANASEKIDSLAPIAASHQETLDNLPVFIISYFADDRLTESKKETIRKGWLDANDDLLTFLRAYAISTTFHSPDTVKYKSTFNRNLTLYNTVILDNEESFTAKHYNSPYQTMINQGGMVLEPAHDVFGGQTGLEAAVNPYILKNAFDVAHVTHGGLTLSSLNYTTDETGTVQATWNKDWGKKAPVDGNGEYKISSIADWLWTRITGDNGKNFDIIARSQVFALLATGKDFGYLVTKDIPEVSTDPEMIYTSEQLSNDPVLSSFINSLGSETIPLGSNNPAIRNKANKNMNLAVSFISVMPYTFALEGK